MLRRYHLGTVAFGSLIIAICNFIRAILEWIETKLKKYDNAFTRAIFTCMRCFFWLLNKFLRFINRNAYIMCAMYGHNFCTSAKQAFDLLLRNILRVVVVDKVRMNFDTSVRRSDCLGSWETRRSYVLQQRFSTFLNSCTSYKI